MTEEEWLEASSDVGFYRLVEHLQSEPSDTPNQARRFCVAACRKVWHLFTHDDFRSAVITAERSVAGDSTEAELRAASRRAERARDVPHTEFESGPDRCVFDAVGRAAVISAWPQLEWWPSVSGLHDALNTAVDHVPLIPRYRQLAPEEANWLWCFDDDRPFSSRIACQLLREVVGNPFRKRWLS